MSFDNILTLLIVVGFGYMMFRGGGCCGGHGRDKGKQGDDHGTGGTSDIERNADR
jgi:hypothetical protein